MIQLFFALINAERLAFNSSIPSESIANQFNLDSTFQQFCKGITVKTRGLEGGSTCISTSQGLIPIASNMISTLIISPENGQAVTGSAGFDVVFETINLISGKSVDLTKQFMTVPQTIDPVGGMIQGMQSISIQQLQNENSAPDASVFSFFQVLNTPSDSSGKTRFTVNIKPGQIQTVGLHRMCTLAMSTSGITAIMPVAQRGAQDDCIRFFVN